jgi:iron complex outermembrane receptor protein
VGFFSIGVFYKNLASFITTQTSVQPYSATGFPLSFLLPGQDGSVPYNVSRPINGPGADIWGVEIALQRDFNFLPAPFDRLGVVQAQRTTVNTTSGRTFVFGATYAF